MTEIEEIFEDYLNMLSLKPTDLPGVVLRDHLPGVGYFDEHMNVVNPTMNLFRLLLKRRGFMDLPQILSDEEYGKIQKQEYYHGFKEKKHAKAFVFGDTYHLGSGTQIGTYFTERKVEAIHYTEGKKGESNIVLPMKMNGAKGTYFLSILNLLHSIGMDRRLLNNPQTEDEKKMKELIDFCFNTKGNEREKHDMYLYMTNSAQMVAVYLGYDYFYMSKDDFYTHLCVFNRGKIVTCPEKLKEGLGIVQNERE